LIENIGLKPLLIPLKELRLLHVIMNVITGIWTVLSTIGFLTMLAPLLTSLLLTFPSHKL
jgi:hypothetical protein